jgi:hypothetical protein
VAAKYAFLKKECNPGVLCLVNKNNIPLSADSGENIFFRFCKAKWQFCKHDIRRKKNWGWSDLKYCSYLVGDVCPWCSPRLVKVGVLSDKLPQQVFSLHESRT